MSKIYFTGELKKQRKWSLSLVLTTNTNERDVKKHQAFSEWFNETVV